MAKTSSSNQKEIEINNFGGFVPLWFLNSYPFYGNANQCSDMVNIDITDPNVLTQGKGLSTLINGNEDTEHDGVVDTLIRSILNVVTASDITYAIGGNKLYQLSSTTVTKNATFPHTINKVGIVGIDGEDIVYYNSDLYYFYNHCYNAGDIGKYNGSTFDETWGSVTASGAEPLHNATSVIRSFQVCSGIIVFKSSILHKMISLL